MKRIKDIIREISHLANDPDSTLKSISDAIAEGVHDYFYHDGRDFGTSIMSYIVLYSHTPQMLELQATHPRNHHDPLKQALTEIMSAPEGSPRGINFEALDKAEIQRVNDVLDEKYKHIYAPHNHPKLPETRSHLSVPIVAYRRRPALERSLETIGVISIETDKVDAFNEYDEEIIELMADYTAGIIDNKRIALSLEALQIATQELAHSLSLNTLDDICHRVTEMAVDILKSLHQEVAFCHVALLEQRGSDRILNFKGIYGSKEILDEKIGKRELNLDNPPEHLNGKVGIVGRCVIENETINVGDAREHPDYVELDARVRSQLAIPIRLENAVLGAINVEYYEAHAFDMNEQRIIESLAAATAIAIQNVRLRVALQEISEASSRSPHIIEVLQVVREKTTELVTFQHSQSVYTTIGIVGKNGGVRYNTPLADESVPDLFLEPGQGLSQHVVRTGESVYRENVHNDVDYIATSKRTVSEFLAPVKVGGSGDNGSVMAIISIQSPIKNAFTEYTFQIVRLFADQAATAIRTHRLFRTLRKLHEISSHKDPYLSTRMLPQISDDKLLENRTTVMINHLNESDPIADRTTELMPQFDEENPTAHTQMFEPLDNNQLLSNATSEPQLAEIIFKITEDVVSFDNEIQFEAMLVIFLPDRMNDTVHIYDFTDVEASPEPQFSPRSLKELNIVTRVIKQKSMITSDHAFKVSVPRYQSYKSYIFVPMIINDKVQGVLAIFSHRKDAFNADDEWMLQNVADRAAEAYSNFRKVRRLNEGVLALNEIDNQIVGLLTHPEMASDAEGINPLEPIWAFIVETAVRLTEADGGSMYAHDFSTETLQLVYNQGAETEESKTSYYLGETGSIEVLAANKQHIVTHLDMNEEEFSKQSQSSLVAVPLIADDREVGDNRALGPLQIIGVLTVRSKSANRFDNDKIDLLKALAGQAVVALSYSELLSRMGGVFGAHLSRSQSTMEEAAALILDKALEFIEPTMGLRGMIHKVNISTSNLDRIYTAGFDEDNEQHQRFIKRIKYLGINQKNGISDAVRLRRRHYIEDVQAEAEYKDFYSDMDDIRSVLSLAIYGSREAINPTGVDSSNGANGQSDNNQDKPLIVRGVITIISSEPNAFQQLDRRLMIYFANQIEMVWLNVHQKERMEELARVNQEWGGIPNMEQDTRARWRVLDFWNKVERLIGATSGSIRERHLGTGKLMWTDGHNMLQNLDDVTVEKEQVEDDLIDIVKTGIPINNPQLNTQAVGLLSSSDDSDTFHIEYARSQLAVPIFDHSRTVRGVISVESPLPYAFDADDMRFLQVLANQAWSVLDTAVAERNHWETSILPTFFSMLHDHKNIMSSLRALLIANPDITEDDGDTSNRLQRYVALVDEAQFTFKQLQTQNQMEVVQRPVVEVVEQIHEQISKVYQDLEFRLDISADIQKGNICMDYDQRVAHIFRNLLLNAVKYGKTPIIIGAELEDDGQTMMLGFWVHDHGDGISHEALTDIFKPKFGQTNNVGGGWGLGLWFTKLFVQALGGVIEKPEPIAGAHGTRFRFWLPCEICVDKE